MSSMDDAFVNAFFSIDRANSKKITKAQLQKFQDSHNYDEKFVEVSSPRSIFGCYKIPSF